MDNFKVNSTSQYTGSTAAAVANVNLALAQSQAAANSAKASANSANIALAQISTIANTANSAAANTVYLQGGLNSANANISLLFAIDNAQNTLITAANTLAKSAYDLANNVSSNTLFLQSALNSANANISLLFAISDSQNTNIQTAYNQANTANSLAKSAYDLANTAISTSSDNTARILAQTAYDKANTANTLAQAAFDQANTAIATSLDQTARNIAQSAYDQANNSSSNTVSLQTSVSSLTNYSQASFAKANSSTNLAQAAFNSSNTVNIKAQNAFDAANSSRIFTQTVWNSSNNVGILAQSAYDKAGLDVTSITTTAGSYGSATAVPVTTIEANGRVTGIVATTISPVTIGTTSISPGATSLTLQGLQSVEVTANPTTNLQLATKQYVDSIGTGTNYHTPAVVATTINLSATYNNGPYSNGVGSNLTSSITGALVIDSYTTLVNDRILVKNQTTSAQNGIYVVSSNGYLSTNWVLTRASDYDSNTTGEITTGDTIFITGGSINGNTSWTQTTGLPITVGTTGLAFIQTSRITSYSAAAPITLTGTQFGLATTGTAGTYGNNAYVPVITTDAYGRVSSVANTAISIPISQVIGLQALEDSQNTSIINLQGGLNTANANIASLIAINLSQNTLITAANTLASNANTLATSAYTIGSSASANTIALQGGLNTANANIAYILAVDLAQNTLITAANTLASNANTLATSAYGIATNANTLAISASANTIALQSGLNTANANIAYILAVDLVQNTNITAATTLAQNAYNQANTDVTSISVASGSYGSATAVPVTTIAANGRVTGIVATAISPVTIGTTSVSPGGTTLTLDGLTAINVSGTPTVSTQVTNKAYVDSVAAGSRSKTPATVATTGSLSATYNNGTSGVGANLVSISTGPLLIDGYTTLVNDRILVKDQTLANQNGLYSVTANGAGPANWILTRSTDYDQQGEILLNDTIFVLNGLINGNTSYVQSNATVSAIGTSNIIFTLSSRIVAYTATPNQLLLTGTQFGLATIGTAGTYGNTTYVPTITTDAYGRVSAVSNTAISIPISQVIGLQALEDSQNTSIINLQGALNTANANIASLIAVNLSQNTNITVANTNAANAVTIASSASANTIALQGALNSANANIASLIAVNLSQNTNITAATTLAQNAYNQANTDVTTINVISGSYGSATAVPVPYVEANGRISSISTSSIQIGINQVTSLQTALDNLNALITDINTNKLIGSYIVSLINAYLGSTNWQGGGGTSGGTGSDTFVADTFVTDVFV
jgi:hypothetical protein